MSRLMVFTENYGVRAGGASYIVDLCNGVTDLFDDMVFASNPRGYAPDVLERVQAPSSAQTVQIRTADRFGVDITSMAWLPRHDALAHRAVGAALARDPEVFAHNVRVCRRAIRRARPSAVLAFNGGYPAGRSVLSMVVAAQEERVPVALCVVSVPVERTSGDLLTWQGTMDELIGDSADAIIVNARAIGEALVSLRGLPASKIHVIHNSLPDVPPPTVWPVIGSRIRIGCVSRLEQLKGTAVLVEAFARLAVEFPDTELMLVGAGPEFDNLRLLIAERGLEDRVTLTGQYDGDVNEMVATFDIYAFPSLWEGLPYAILEAMRLGRPIVSTDVGGIPEALTHETTGLLVAPGSVDELTEALRRLLSDPHLRDCLGRAARERFVGHFSLDAMWARVEAVFREAGLATH